jgi:peptide/nickel transport system ATP-binding protein
LLKSIPRLGAKKARDFRLASIYGSVPDPYNLPQGCPFHPRCPRRIPDICNKEVPQMIEVEPGHKVRCVLYQTQ